MKYIVLIVFMTSACVTSRNNCDTIYYVDSIGGCDGKGMCGVTAISRKGNRIKAIKEYPVLSEQVCSE